MVRKDINRKNVNRFDNSEELINKTNLKVGKTRMYSWVFEREGRPPFVAEVFVTEKPS